MNEPTKKCPEWDLEQEWAANHSETSFVSWLCAELAALRASLREKEGELAESQRRFSASEANANQWYESYQEMSRIREAEYKSASERILSLAGELQRAQRQRETLDQDNFGLEFKLARAQEALRKLNAEVIGITTAYSAELREAIGLTNLSCLIQRRDEAAAALEVQGKETNGPLSK